MSRNAHRQSGPITNGTNDAISQYLAALHDVYPAAKGETRVVVRHDKSVVVSTTLPSRPSDRMHLFDRMAEVGTRLLLETDQYIILSYR